MGNLFEKDGTYVHNENGVIQSVSGGGKINSVVRDVNGTISGINTLSTGGINNDPASAEQAKRLQEALDIAKAIAAKKKLEAQALKNAVSTDDSEVDSLQNLMMVQNLAINPNPFGYQRQYAAPVYLLI